MRSFLVTLTLFLLPALFLFAFPFAVLLFSGEFMSLEKVGELARGERPVLIGNAYSNIRQAYQVQETLKRQPEVLALGTSRVGEFRSVFFKDPSVFYNDTGITDALSLNRYFVEAVSAHPPKVIIAGMDQFFFKTENAKNNIVERPNSLTASVRPYDPFLESLFRQGGWWKVYDDFHKGKFTLAQVFTPTDDGVIRIGLRARAANDGFLGDGSNRFGNVIEHKSEQEKASATIVALTQSVSDVNGDEYGAIISPEALAEVRHFLEEAKERGITVIGFIPPVAPSVYAALASHPDASYAGTFRKLGPTLAAIYKEYGYDFYDFSDSASFGGSDDEMVESKHGSEKMYLRMFILMSQSKALAPYVDVRFLSQALASATSTYAVFPLTAK